MKKVPARLHIIPASGCSKALILRRGPSEQVASILWDRATDSFDMGQWLKGRIYEHRSDLSPDGQHMVYFAGNGRSWWTAVSRAPFLRAVLFEPQSGTWCGGGAFDSGGQLWLNGGPASGGRLPDGLKQAPEMAYPASTDGFHMGDTYTTILTRRSWTHESGAGYSALLHHDLWSGWALELRFEVQAKNRAIVSNRYALVHIETGNRIEQPDWEWAEPFEDRLYFAAGGMLYRAGVAADGQVQNPEVIKDFNEMVFDAIKAPYEGVRTR